ncbi:MAG: ppk1 [Sphingobacterium sp.]|jgi:polyphosphate kinase|nr:ppk1 [Sphingobacterium sp.]
MTHYQNESMLSRDLSWLTFNGRLLDEAAKSDVPVGERLKFLAIFSSNMDEFYCVRIPVLMALKKMKKQIVGEKKSIRDANLKTVKEIIQRQQKYFGIILRDGILPELHKRKIHLIYNEAIPDCVKAHTERYFFERIAAFLEISYPTKQIFIPKNNHLYLAVEFANLEEAIALINIPSDRLPRFFSRHIDGTFYIIFIDDIIRAHMSAIFNHTPVAVTSFKISRDAELDLQDEFTNDLSNQITNLLSKRDYAMASRFLYDETTSQVVLRKLISCLQLEYTNHMGGGVYHNLKDFFTLPIDNPDLLNVGFPVKTRDYQGFTLFDEIRKRDILIHTPYDSYDIVLRFFNEAVLHPEVEEIFITLYRVATDSQIVNALISAAKNGKRVTVFVELKARFDEANNIKWAKKMKSAGIQVIDCAPKLKVHAKIALFKLKSTDGSAALALLSTGNFNERTAKVYTDHTFLTAAPAITTELGILFEYLNSDAFGKSYPLLIFEHLLVTKFNLLPVFIQLIDREIEMAHRGEEARITIKLNNLEEGGLIDKLYEASQAGVKIDLIVRTICRLRPGIAGLSEHIRVTRIVDRYLEHGRIFIFNNGGEEKMFLGSSDWMERNILRRIEVCFPIYDLLLQRQIKQLIKLQLEDDTAAVQLDQNAQNISMPSSSVTRSQKEINKLINAGFLDLPEQLIP